VEGIGSSLMTDLIATIYKVAMIIFIVVIISLIL